MSQLKFDPTAPVILISPLLEGENGLKRKTKMVLDTGATYVMISWKLAEALKLEPQKTKKWVDLTTASAVERTPVIKVKAITVLGKRVKNVEVAIKNLPEESRVDGLLGLSFLKNFDLRIDFENGVLELNSI